MAENVNETPFKKPKPALTSEERRKRYQYVQKLYKNAVIADNNPSLYTTLQTMSGPEKFARLEELAATKPLFISRKRTLTRGTPLYKAALNTIQGIAYNNSVHIQIPNNARLVGGKRTQRKKSRSKSKRSRSKTKKSLRKR